MSTPVLENHKRKSEDRKSLFAPVLGRVGLVALAQFASSLWKQRNVSPEIALVSEIGGRNICKVTKTPYFGSCHAIFPLKFEDGSRWVLKIPANGVPDEWTEMAGQRLRTEALTMRFLRRETTIPVPEVFAFDPTCSNKLQCPFILMEFINGTPLQKAWFKGKASQNSVDKFRARVLQDLSKAMVKLRDFRHTLGGTLLYDEEGRFASVGPMSTVYDPDSFNVSSISDTKQVTVYEAGPFDDSKKFLFDKLRRKEAPIAIWDKGIWRLLLAFVNWIPFKVWEEDKNFVLAHPDFSFQNVLVSDEGALQGLIDWNGVAAVPRCIGCEAYPRWLTRDSNPSTYNYDRHTGDLILPKGSPEDPPEELAFYRNMYARLIDAQLSEKIEGSTASMTGLHIFSRSKRRFTVTRNSRLVDTLLTASQKPKCAAGILENIFCEITRLTAADWRGNTPITEARDSDVMMQEDDFDISMNDDPPRTEDDQSSFYSSSSKSSSRRPGEKCMATGNGEEKFEDGQDREWYKPVGLYNEFIGDNADGMDIDTLETYLNAEYSSDKDETEHDSDVARWNFSDVVYAFANEKIDSGVWERLREGFDDLLF